MYEITSTLFCGASSEKLPSMSVIVPSVVLPFTTTLAPMIGSPVESFTFPVTFCWAKAVNEMLTNVSNQNKCFIS